MDNLLLNVLLNWRNLSKTSSKQEPIYRVVEHDESRSFSWSDEGTAVVYLPPLRKRPVLKYCTGEETNVLCLFYTKINGHLVNETNRYETKGIYPVESKQVPILGITSWIGLKKMINLKD